MDFIAKTKHLFSKKVVFWNFIGQKLKILKIRDSHLLELFKYYLLCSFLAIRFISIFLMNFQTFIFFAPKSREVTSQNRLYFKIWLPESDFFFTEWRRIDVRRGMPSFMSISARVQELFRKNRGVAEPPPPPGGYVLTAVQSSHSWRILLKTRPRWLKTIIVWQRKTGPPHATRKEWLAMVGAIPWYLVFMETWLDLQPQMCGDALGSSSDFFCYEIIFYALMA